MHQTDRQTDIQDTHRHAYIHTHTYIELKGIPPEGDAPLLVQIGLEHDSISWLMTMVA